MSDERLRDLERRYLKSGASEDLVAWIGQRVQVGQLAADRLLLAAALGADGFGRLDPGQSFADWLGSLPFRVKRGRVEPNWARVPIAMAHACRSCVVALPAFSVEEGDERRQAFEAALELAEGLLVGRRQPLAAHARLQELVPEPHRDGSGWVYLPPFAAYATFVDAALQLLDSRLLPVVDWKRVLDAAFNPRQTWDPDPDAGSVIEAAIQDAFPRMEGRVWLLRLAVRDEVVPWALGYADPVAERVRSREID